MPVTWSAEQLRVIRERGKDMLVSAAAGSGKTAVLVERILGEITDEKDPVDIDRLLVVTFTKSAASEMKSRIREELSNRVQADPDNARLQRQLVLVHNAKIMTIDSFCLEVLRSHFQMIGLDPSFRVADEGEVLLLEQDAVKEIVTEAYEQEDTSEFTQFLEQFATGKGDEEVEEMILQLYHYALARPYPKDWLKKCREAYDREEGETGFSEWISFIEEDTKRQLTDIRSRLETALLIARESDGPGQYEKALVSDLKRVEDLLKGTSYRTCSELFRSMGEFEHLGTRRAKDSSETKRVRVQNIRNECKEELQKLKSSYYYDDPDTIREVYERSGVVIRELTFLTEAFIDRLSAKKAEKNILDFGDMEHLALQVLTRRDAADPDVFVPTAVAGEYAETFHEVMTDEYQDINLVQEMILKSVSGGKEKVRNRFMVGDVKQSIYRFRLARPELFMEKFHQYRKEEEEAGSSSGSCRIDLHQNYRSRTEVIDTVNDIFRRIMTEQLGSISYDEDAALKAGAFYPGASKEEERDPYESELLLTDGSEKGSDETDASARELREAEAGMVGERIRELVGNLPVTDKESGELRPARYGDIVILLRTVSGWAETFGEVLSGMGIPCYTGSQEGYFSAAEVRIVLSYLQILDNQLQDIPMAAVLRSAIGELTDEELAQIRLAGDRCGAGSFYECAKAYVREQESGDTKRKLERFFDTYETLRRKAAYTPVHELIWQVLDLTGYGDYAAALPAGRQREANLNMLVEKAIAYEATSYHGLYHFVRYIENLQKYEVDYGEAALGSESENRVRLMSIHKSKGLEFPIVFVSGLGKQFNETEIRSRIVLHSEWGIACDCIWQQADDLPLMRQPTLLKKAIQRKLESENLGEELRILYVAMTRAREKLILTGAVKDAAKKVPVWQEAADTAGEGTLSYSDLLSAGTYLDWVAPAALLSGNLSLRICPVSSENKVEEKNREEERKKALDLLKLDPSVCQDPEAESYLKEAFSSRYPYEGSCRLTGNFTVSELKKQFRDPEEEALSLYPDEPVVPLIPKFIQQEDQDFKAGGALRGTVYHTFMENLDYSATEELPLQLEELISCGKITEDEAELVCPEDITVFLHSGIGQRMKEAALAGTLVREQPFVLGVKAEEIYAETGEDLSGAEDEVVLVQGIIDAYFVRNGQITLVDYKTDRVPDMRILAERYHVQIRYYREALERLTGMPVTDAVLYSFHLHEEIHLALEE